MSDLADTLKNGSPEDAKTAADQQRKEDRKRQLRLEDAARREVKAELRGPVPDLIAYPGDELPHAKFAPRKPLLYRDGQVFFAGGEIAETFSTRGYGKTWFLMTVALLISAGKSGMGFDARERRRVLYVDGEMARQDIQSRFQKLVECTGVPLTDHLVIVAADWQTDFLPRMDTPEGQQAIERFVAPADVIIFDNRSCLFDSEGEKDPTAWQPAQDYLLSLRRRDKATWLAHHANRQGGARGLGKPEDVMSLVMKLAKPDDYAPEQGARFICDCTPPDGKLRSVHGSAAVPFGLWLTDTGWAVEKRGPDVSEFSTRKAIREYLELADNADDRPRSANAAYSKIKGNRNIFIKVWGEMLKDGEIAGNKKDGYKPGVVAVPF